MTVDLASLTNKTSLDGTEQVILNDAGTAKDATVAVLAGYVASKGVMVGPYADTTALLAAYPVATSKGVTALVGSTAPYAEYVCNGSAWLALTLWNTDGTLRTPAGGSVGVGGGGGGYATGSLSKPWSSGYLKSEGAAGFNSPNPGTFYGKMKCAGNVKRVRAIVLNAMYSTGKTYSQTLTAITLNLVAGTGVGLVAGDLMYLSQVAITTGNLTAGWYPVASTTANTVTLTSTVSQTATGTCSYSRPVRGIKCSVAVTEKSGYSSVRELFTPVFGDVDHNATAPTDPYGLYPIDFGGGTLMDNPSYDTGRANAGTGMAASFMPMHTLSASNWVALPDVASDDGLGSNLLFRVYKDITVSGTFSQIDPTFTALLNNQTLLSVTGGIASKGYRPFFHTLTDSVDGIATPTLIPASTALGYGFYIAFEFDYAIAPKSIAAFGDSTTAASPYSTYNGPKNAVSATFSGTTMTLNADTVSTVSGGSGVPLRAGESITFAGKTIAADGTDPFIVSLLSGENGKSGSTYQVSPAQGSVGPVSTTLTNSNLKSFFSWVQTAAGSKSTNENPIEVFNGAIIGRNSNFYFTQAKSLLEAGIVPYCMYLQGYTYNDGPAPAATLLATFRGRLLDVIARAKKAGVQKVLVSTWPLTKVTLADAGALPRMIAHNVWIKGLATSGVTDGCPDFEAVRLSMGSDNFFSADGTTELAPFADGIHQGRAAEALMAEEFAKFI